MKMQKVFVPLAGVAAMLVLGASGPAVAQSKTAQSAMVSTTYVSDAYEITPTTTYSFDSACAETYFTTVITGPVVTCERYNNGTSCVGSGPGATQPDENSGQLISFLNAQARCMFFNGGTLSSDDKPYTKTVPVNVPAAGPNRGKWNYTWTYTITPDGTPSSTVKAGTCWSAASSDSLTVDVKFEGFVSSESYLLQSSKTKYSFTLLESGVTRVRGVSAQLQWSPDGVSGWTAVDSPLDLNNTDTDGDTVNDSLEVSVTGTDYVYYSNGGVFGNAAVYNSLHAPGYLAAGSVQAILNSDSFTNNNDDLAHGNVHQATYSGTWSDVPGDPDGDTFYYRTVISGTIKGNASSGSTPFNIASSPVIVGGCKVPVPVP